MPCNEIVLFGGSFNPPHYGHLFIVDELLQRYPHVCLIPCARHAFAKDLAAFEHRVEMCHLLGTQAEVLDVERHLSGYTIDTVQALQEYAPLRLAIGADVLAETKRWRSWDDIQRLAPPIVIARQGFDDGGHAEVTAVPTVSSTQVRERLAQGRSVDDLVPPAITAYIEEFDLY